MVKHILFVISVFILITTTSGYKNSHKLLHSSIEHLVKYVQKSSDKNSLNFLKISKDNDKEQCLLRIVCEICVDNSTDQSPLIKNIKTTFSDKIKHLSKRPKPNDHLFPFRYAAYVGKTTKSLNYCAQVFPVCSIPSDYIISMINNIITLSDKQKLTKQHKFPKKF